MRRRYSHEAEDYYGRITGAVPTEQVEGLTPDELTRALLDRRTQHIRVTNPDTGEKIRLPFAVPVRYASWINPKYLEKHGYDMDTTLYCAIPQSVLATFDQKELASAMQQLQKSGVGSLLIDHSEHIESPLATVVGGVETDDLTTEGPKGSPAAIFHYNTVVRGDAKKAAEYENASDRFMRDLSAEEVEEYFDQLWDVYQSRFQDLVDDHPIAGMIPREDLLAQLQSENCRTTAYMGESGKIVAFGYLVNDLKLCPWLNADHLLEKAGDLPIVYMPGIAAVKGLPGLVAGDIMRHQIKNTIQEYEDFYLAFECTNVSMQYIPLFVRRAFGSLKSFASAGPLDQNRILYQMLHWNK